MAAREGPPAPGPTPGEDRDDYPGRRLGMPERGAGSIAGFGRRLAAIVIDWMLCQVVAIGLFGVGLGEGGAGAMVPLAVFAVENLLLVSTLGTTIGHRLLGVRVIRFDGSAPGAVPAAVRTVLLCLAVPALIWDKDGRGLHDKAANTVIVRA